MLTVLPLFKIEGLKPQSDGKSLFSQPSQKLNIFLILSVACILIAGSLGVYYRIGDLEYSLAATKTALQRDLESENFQLTQEQAEQKFAESIDHNNQIAIQADIQLLKLVSRLKIALQTRKMDLEGHTLLVKNSMKIGDLKTAKTAQKQILNILGERATANDLLIYVDLLIRTAGGYISAESQQYLALILKMEPSNMVARYYTGFLYAQMKQPNIALNIWSELVEIAPNNNRLVRFLQKQIDLLSNEEVPAQTENLNMFQIPVDQLNDRISQMVASLEDRIYNEGGSIEDWAKLIKSYNVLGKHLEAENTLKKAKKIFKNEPQKLELLENRRKQISTILDEQ